MRAGLPAREPGMLESWYDMDLYHETLRRNEGKPLFALHDGPPFSNGELHMGHALNKCLKDFICPLAAMRGYYTPYIPGWDNHGMPIESAIIKENKLNHKAMPVPEFRSACHDFAQNYIDVQMEGFKRLGVVGDWEHPYKTMAPSFEAEEVKVFGKMYKKGYIYKGLKPVYWCYHDETALARPRSNIRTIPAPRSMSSSRCTTIRASCRRRQEQALLRHLDDDDLDAARQPRHRAEPGRKLRLVRRQPERRAVSSCRSALTEKVMNIGGLDSYEVSSRHPGAFFENMLADHPFLPKTSRLVLADYVTMDSGTGCVHTAPASARTTIRPAALRHGYGRSRGRSGPPHRLRRQIRRHEDRGIQPRHPQGHEGKRLPVRLRGDRPQLSALLALQEAHHLPRHPAVVLLRRLLSRTTPSPPARTCAGSRWGKDRMTP